MRSQAIIFDLDGTLANNTHRLHHVLNRPKNHEAYHAGMMDDVLMSPMADIFDALSSRFTMLICTTRPEAYREDTVTWLQRQGYYNPRSYEALYMRPDGDRREDYVVKRELLQKMRLDGYAPFLAVDDRLQVARMWREEGLICLHCAGTE